MRQVMAAVPDILALAKKRHEERIEDLRQAGVVASTPARSTLLESVEPRPFLAKVLPSELTVEEFVFKTVPELTEVAEQRLRACAGCHPRGGACEKLDEPGQQPKWTDEGIVWGWCDRWLGYFFDRRMKGWGFPWKLMRKRVEDLEETSPAITTAKDYARAYIDRFSQLRMDGKGLAMYGGTGIGKTHLAVAICRELIERRALLSAAYWQASDLLAYLRSQGVDEYERERKMEHARKCHMLVLDDLGVEKDTDFACEQINRVIDCRWRDGLPFIVTSNNSSDVAMRLLGPRVAGRIYDATIPINFVGEDYRTSEHPST